MMQLIGLVRILKDKIKIFCGNLEDNKFVFMLSFFLKKYDFHFVFIPSNWKQWYYEKEGKKFIDNDIRYCLNLGIFQFILHDYTGIDYIHVIVDEEYDYHAPEQRYFLERFKILLKVLAEEYNSFSCIPCRFRCSVKPNKKFIYYLTIRHNWLIEHNLGVLTTIRFPDCYMTEKEINYYFPKYDQYMNSKFVEFIPYIKIEKFEGEAN